MRALVILALLGACAHHEQTSTIGAPCTAGSVGCQPAYEPMQPIQMPVLRPRKRPIIPAAMLETELGAKVLKQGELAVCQ